MERKHLLIILCCFFSNILFSQDNFKNFDNICFCQIGLSHPKRITELDNNLELLFALRDGKTLKELSETNIKYKLSQIKLLWLSNLLKRENDTFFTTIPILTNEETLQLRATSKKIATNIIPLFQNDFTKLTKSLKKQNLENSAYTLFFSFILDGLVWDILANNKTIETYKITEDEPLWSGTFWYLIPKRSFSCGTNSLSSGNYTIHENHSDNATISISNYNVLSKMLNDYKKNGKITNQQVFNCFGKNDFFDKNGKLKIPVIEETDTNKLYKHSLNIATEISSYLSTNVDYSTILSSCNIKKSKKIIILYHEIMWDILNKMENKNEIHKPIAFENPQKANDTNLRDLVFITIEKQK